LFHFRYKGLLLYGPPGTGKTSLASSCAYDLGANLFTINGPEIISQYHGESEQTLYDVFTSAKQAAPAVVRFSSNANHFFSLSCQQHLKYS
jgi:SpoVK/Ycf46/Vps4 family AAA+-type ATPase